MDTKKLQYGKTMPKLLFAIIFITGLFWIIANSVNVYKYAVTGAFFEIMWLPAVLSTLSIPVLSFICWYIKGCRVTSIYLYMCLASTVVLAFLYLS